VLPLARVTFVTLDCAFLRLLRAEAQSAQNPPDLCLGELHSVQPFDNNPNTLERPQIGTKAMVGGLLQHGSAHLFKLVLVKPGWPTRTRHSTQCVDAIFIEQTFPCVHGLARHTHRHRHFGGALACQQHASGAQTLLRCFVQPLLRHANHLQSSQWKYNACACNRLSCI
jgi:hypothetical protein